MKWIGLIALIIVFILFVYNRFTAISFENDKPIISKMYCMFHSQNVLNDPVIFIPGIKGSLLEKNGSVVWLSLTQVVHKTEPLMYTKEFGNKEFEGFNDKSDDIHPIGIFTRLTVIPFFFEYRPYYRMTATLACNPSAYVFAYDWRDYPDRNMLRLSKLVDKVKKETGKYPSLVAHSMGGLIAHGFVKQYPKKVNKIVYVSVPFNPGVGYFDDINEGVSTGLNKNILSKETIFSHPASFLLLPHNGSNRFSGKEFMRANDWKENKWSVFKKEVNKSDAGDIDMKQFQTRLNQITKYHKFLDKPKSLENPFLIINSNCHDTVFEINRDGNRSYIPGDGRVSQLSSYPFDVLKNKIEFMSCARHDAQMDDKAIVNQIMEFLAK